MDDIQLPALPIGILFDRDFAQEYARAAVLADRERATVKESVTVQDERAAFEAWAMNCLGLKPWSFERFDHGEGEYCNDYIGSMWTAWHARASINKGNGNG